MFTLYRRKLSGQYEQQWPGTGTSCSHTSNIVPYRLAERVWWTKSQSSLPNYFRFIGLRSSLQLIHFRHGPNTCSHWMTLHFRNWRSAARLRCRSHRSYVWTEVLSGWAIFLWPRNENARTKQKQQTNGNKAIWLVYRMDTNARGFWLVKRTLGWKNFTSKNFLEINRYFALTSYCNTIGQSNNAFSILGFSLAGKRRLHVLIFLSIGWKNK